ncbi:acyl-CoA thioesterase [Parahaliea mediterranea]|uniref:Thioesterase family protein n=1 Tax=Parahaliea mediterranea TaxID=651086 RepID=A0A939INL7_9GAMM|nr:thioesterase family protein [Parahaliea mediterranea]MBN7798690.1 thioesterase family protein [Parahaliea mediterranea]
MESPATVPALHPLDAATTLEALSDDRFQGCIPPAYANFIGPFGGVLAACLLRAPCMHERRLGDPLAITVNFGGPVAQTPFEIHARPTITNRSSQHWALELHQDGSIPLTATAVFARRRETWSAQEAARPEVAGPGHYPPIDSRDLPAWVANYDIRVISGGMSFLADSPRAQDSSETLLWARDLPARPLDFPALLALSDVFFPRIFVRRPTFVPVGTISLSTYFHADAGELADQGDAHLLCRARGKRFHNGYFDHSGELWGAGGALLATTHQVVYYKE